MYRPRVLFVEHNNAARSHMAEALLRHYGEGRYDVYSAGVQSGEIGSEAADVLREQGVDVPSASNTVADVSHLTFDYVISVCDSDDHDCLDDVEVPGKPERMRWRFQDPLSSIGDRFLSLRRIRDEILSRIRFFILTDRGY